MAHRSPLVQARSARAAAPRRPALAALVAVLLLVLAACSGGMSASSGDGGGTAAGGVEEPNASADDSAGGGVEMRGLGDGVTAQERGAGSPGRVAPLTRQVIMTGEVTLQAEDLAAVREEVDRLVGRYGGYIASERSFDDHRGRLVEARLTLRIPSARFEQVMDDFADVATVVDPSRKAVDVTTEVIDVDSRIRTQEVSLDRLRSFLRRAADIDSTIRLESEIAEREADLASLRAQQNYLEDQTSLATITVTLRQPEEQPAPRADDGGFLAGLYGGWAALKGVVVVGATILGAVIPFALAIALVGVPVLLLLRAARRRRPAPATAVSPPPPA